MPSTDTRHSHRKQSSGNKPGAVRWIIPIALILAWLAVMGIGGPTFGKVSDIVTNSQADFLPVDAQATEVQDRIGDFSDSEGVPAIIVAEADGEISDSQLSDLQGLSQSVSEIDHVTQASPPIESDDGQAVEIIALVSEDADTATVVEEIRGELENQAPEGLNAAVSGPAGLVADLSAAFAGIDSLLLIVALVTVLIILVLVYRSPILPFLVLFTSVAALSGAILTVYFLAKEGIFPLSGQTQGILSIIVIGAATDYGLLYTARFREALHQTPSRWQATRIAWKGTFPAVMASGTTVIAGLLCLLLSMLESNRALGPVTAIGVVFAILAGLTLLPALLAVFGRAAMWPKIPRVEETASEPHSQANDLQHQKGLWPAVARLVDRKSRTVWIICAIGLGVAAVGASQLDADGVPQSEFVLGESEARDGLDIIDRHFPGGTGDPTYVLAPEEHGEAAAERLAQSDDVASVAFTAQDAPGGSVPYPAPPAGPLANAEPTVDQGDVLIEATLAYNTDSAEAKAAVDRLRSELSEVDSQVLVGGSTAVQVDTIAAAERDRAVIIPIILVVILIILIILLRSILMPVLLVATTVLSFFSALGVATGIFALLDMNQADPTVPLFSFVFLVALGIDYNIFLMSRVREEVVEVGHRKGVLVGLVTTGGVITSAGVVLAATFAALAVLPILFLVQLAIIVTVGVLMDTIIVRSLLVPSLTLDIGPKSWWPSRVGSGGRHRGTTTG